MINSNNRQYESRPYVNIEALSNGDKQAIEKTAQDWSKLNQRQRDKIRHNVPKSVYEAVVSHSKNVLKTIKDINVTTHRASESSGQRASFSQQHYFDSQSKSESEKREFSEKADRQHEREQNRIKDQHTSEQNTIKEVAKWTIGCLVAVASIAAYAMKKD